MTSLVIGGTSIPVAVSSPAFSRTDAVDRSRTFDGTFFASQTGGAARAWSFTTPPVATGLYEGVLGTVAAQFCSGDILTLPTMCHVEFLGGKPVRAQGTKVTLDFVLHEVQPAKVLLRYLPGDTITGESFSRSTTATYHTSAGVVASAAINAKRDAHYTAIGGTRSLLREGARTNAFTKSQELDDAAWGKNNLTVVANAVNAPDGTATADRLQETAVTAAFFIDRAFTTTASTPQPLTLYAKAGERDWIWLQTNLRDGTTPRSYVNLTTGAVGTVAAGHTIRLTALASGWYRIELVVNSGAGATATVLLYGPTFQDGTISYAGAATHGIYVWGVQHEQDEAFASSYIPTTTIAVTRGADLYVLPFTAPPGELTLSAKFVEAGTVLSTNARVAEITNAAGDDPRLILYFNGFYRTFHGTTLGNVGSVLATAPTIGQVVELVSRLFGDGSVDTTQSIASGAATISAQSAALALATAWAGQLVYLGSQGAAGNNGFMALQSFKIVAGARSLAEMRTL